MSNPLVSAIIPCYKQAHYLGRAVDSVLSQTYSSIEVIVIDDGSPDDVGAVTAAYARDSRVRVIRQENQGLAAARNRGAAEAQGTYLQFLDSDDWIHPQKFAIQVAALEADPSVGFVYSDFYMVYNDTHVSDEWSASKSLGVLEPEIFNTLWLNNCVANMTVLLRRDWFDRSGGFDTTPVLTEDYEMWMRLTALGCRVHYIPERLGYYRQHASSMTQDGLQPARKAAARTLIAQRFPELVGPATDYAIDTIHASWKKWVDELQETIKRQDEHIADLQRQGYHPQVAMKSMLRSGARTLRLAYARVRPHGR
jgi:glycosyltransferase involved in cell wall biosynthesis